MAAPPRLICASGALADGGPGVRFEVATDAGPTTAFAVRFDGAVYAYVNRCAHIGIEMDWQPGRFFDDSGLYLVCATHGAVYRPEDGACIAGPCAGARLVSLRVFESDGAVYLE